MSMISTSMSSVNQFMSMQSKLYQKLDSDSNGVLSQDEFVAGRPSDVTEEMAINLYSSIDSSGSGELSEEDFLNAFQPPDLISGSQAQASASVISMLMDQPPPPPPFGDPGSQEEVYSSMDTDQDGVVSREEFLAARPEDVSEEDSLSLFNSLDSEGTGSITLEQFTAGMTPPDASDEGSNDNASNLAQDIIDQLLSIIQDFNQGYVDTEAVAA